MIIMWIKEIWNKLFGPKPKSIKQLNNMKNNTANTRTTQIEDVFTEYLLTQPEQGMGYQNVNITLYNRKKLTGRRILNSKHLVLNPNEMINVKDIIKIEVKR